jgi:tetratricopeptide (TPR) repeat protein
VAIIGVAAGGCETFPGAAARQIRQAHQAYQYRQYARCEGLVGPVIAANADRPATAEAYYLRGLSRLRTSQKKAGRADFEAGLRIAQRADLIALLHAQLGNLEYEAGNYRRAAGYYQRAEPSLPPHPPSDRVMLRHGISLQRSGRFREAKPILGKLILRFPSGRPAEQARRKVTWPHDYHCVQCGVYSKANSAKTAARRIRERGVKASSWRETRNGKTRYVVRAGEYRDYQAAQRGLRQIRAVVRDAFIVP